MCQSTHMAFDKEIGDIINEALAEREKRFRMIDMNPETMQTDRDPALELARCQQARSYLAKLGYIPAEPRPYSRSGKYVTTQ